MPTQHQKRIGAAGKKAFREACDVRTFRQVFKAEMRKAGGFHSKRKHKR